MKPFSDCTLDLGWTHPNATLVRPICDFSVDVRRAESVWLPLGLFSVGLLSNALYFTVHITYCHCQIRLLRLLLHGR